MQSLNRLDTGLYRFLNKSKPLPGDVGIEVELEGDLKPTEIFWDFKGEGSLRGGGEYVLKKPILLKNLKDALQELSLVDRKSVV